MKSYDGYNKIDKDEFLFGLRDLGILLPKVAAEVIIYLFRNQSNILIWIQMVMYTLKNFLKL